MLQYNVGLMLDDAVSPEAGFSVRANGDISSPDVWDNQTGRPSAAAYFKEWANRTGERKGYGMFSNARTLSRTGVPRFGAAPAATAETCRPAVARRPSQTPDRAKVRDE
jgi:hypothetical protein